MSAELTTGLHAKEASESKALTSTSSGDAPLSTLSTETGTSGDRSSGECSTTPDPVQANNEAGQSTENGEFDPRNTDLNYFHGKARFQQLISEGQFTKLKGLAVCCRDDGKVELHSWCSEPGTKASTVVVKRVVTARVSANLGKERNERIASRGLSQRHAEDALNEIGVYCYLAEQQDLPHYILRMHAVFQAGSDVWLVLEHANGGDLFAIVQKLRREGSDLSSSQLMTWTWQLLQAVSYLHKHRIGHRDISMENVLLSDGVVRLMDFGQAVQTHSAKGALLRYFNALGKPYYRPPECYTPAQKVVEVHVPKVVRPGAITFVQTVSGDCMCEVLLPPTAVPGQVCSAEPWGYTVPPVDLFACGVCIFIMATGMPPWRQANLSDPHFAWVHQCGISQLLKAWKKPMPPAADELMASMVHSEPAQRPSVEQCLSHLWFEPLNGTAVPTHPDALAGSLLQQCSTSSHCATPSAVAEQPPFTPALDDFVALGDPYAQEATVRSVVGPAHGSTATGGALAGDFYAPDDQLWRSVSRQTVEELTLERFSAAHEPPTMQPNDSFGLEPSTFHVSHKEPAKLGNHLLNFLMAVGAVVTKVNSKKFTIKAEIDGDAGACVLKVRISSEGDDRLAIEFQRRSGESTALHKVFDDALKHFAQAATPSKSSKSADDAVGIPESTVNGSDDTAEDTRKPSAGAGVFDNKSNGNPPLATAAFASQLGHLAPAPPPRFQGRAGSKIVRRSRSVPAISTRPRDACSKNAASEKNIGRTISVNNAVGSGLNAVRMRSKSNCKLAVESRFNSTF